MVVLLARGGTLAPGDLPNYRPRDTLSFQLSRSAPVSQGIGLAAETSSLLRVSHGSRLMGWMYGVLMLRGAMTTHKGLERS